MSQACVGGVDSCLAFHRLEHLKGHYSFPDFFACVSECKCRFRCLGCHCWQKPHHSLLLPMACAFCFSTLVHWLCQKKWHSLCGKSHGLNKSLEGILSGWQHFSGSRVCLCPGKCIDMKKKDRIDTSKSRGSSKHGAAPNRLLEQRAHFWMCVACAGTI